MQRAGYNGQDRPTRVHPVLLGIPQLLPHNRPNIHGDLRGVSSTTFSEATTGDFTDQPTAKEGRGNMHLEDIEKSRYRKRFRIVFVAIVVVLAIVALGTSTLLIAIFGTPGESHFWLNLAGVVVGGGVVALALIKLREHPYLREVVYVWDLKQQLNQVYRKQAKIEPLVEQNDPDAIAIMYFFYRGSQQLYELDDNTITMDTITLKIRALERRIEELGLDITTDSFSKAMLERF
jgi:hypothetical protein